MWRHRLWNGILALPFVREAETEKVEFEIVPNRAVFNAYHHLTSSFPCLNREILNWTRMGGLAKVQLSGTEGHEVRMVGWAGRHLSETGGAKVGNSRKGLSYCDIVPASC